MTWDMQLYCWKMNEYHTELQFFQLQDEGA